MYAAERRKAKVLNFSIAYPGVPIGGTWTGSLANSGEDLQLIDAIGENILGFDYEDDWHPATDGRGCSLVVVNENALPGAWDSKTQWRPSYGWRGSPGGPEPATPQDSDGDGQSDSYEANFGSDPRDPGSRFEVQATAAPAITFPAARNLLYQIDESPDLQTWTLHSTIGPFNIAQAAIVPITLPGGSKRFYRVRSDLP